MTFNVTQPIWYISIPYVYDRDDVTNKNKHLRRMRSSLTINNACWHTASGVWIIFSRLFFSLRVFCVFIKIAFIRCAVLVKRIKNLSKWSTRWERNISTRRPFDKLFITEINTMCKGECLCYHKHTQRWLTLL